MNILSSLFNWIGNTIGANPNTLTTTAKTIVGSLNELKSGVNGLNTNVSSLATRVGNLESLRDISSTVTLTPTKGTVSEVVVKRCGRVIQCSIKVKNSSAITEGNDIFTGTISATARPQLFIQTPIYHGSRVIIAGISSGGTVTFRAAKGTSEANTDYNAGFTFLALN